MRIVIFTALILGVAMSAFADIENGIRAYNERNFDTARIEFSKAAQRNDPKGKHLLASLYYLGHGVNKDIKKAVSLFTEAAEGNYGPSQANLGLMYHKGEGMAPDIKKAIYYYEAAANNGNLQSLFNLGQIYRKGEGVRQDMKKAGHYYKIAADVGHIPSVNEYGLLFAQGAGVRLDYVEAYAWISFAVAAGDAQAKKNLKQLEQILSGELPKAKRRAEQVRQMIQKERLTNATPGRKPVGQASGVGTQRVYQ